MDKAVDRSRRVLVVLTPRWAASEWSGFEAILAGTSDPAGRQRKLIPLMLEDCDPPARIKALTFVDFRSNANEELAFANLLRSISDSNSGTPPPPIVPAKPRVDWKAELPDLLVRSGRVQTNARTALCIQAGIDVNDLTFLEAPPRAFAIQLVNYLDQSGDRAALQKICRALEPLLKGVYSENLRSVLDELRSAG
jgi:hypothetical protein